ncbi:endospore germination permease [Paenibacillus sp. CF384]|uniref:GerAB/ArcD/ProY family transporter n=1 Tax=Paenibacillus sp. CF384 TaxID=1884382 RepID=UPI0008997F57|nr:endospore germination permease [Paenibacillus sp. CF384]SDW19474.1 spore germination protein KB [Paenibacillus sp. CF384]
MIEKGKISALQLAMILYPAIVATGDLIIPAFTARLAKRDLWMSPIWAIVVGLIVLYIMYRLYKIYPNETLIQQLERIFGSILGKAIGACYLFAILHINGMIVRQYADFVTMVFLRNTPILFIIASMVLVCAITVRGGIEAIARSAQILVPLLILSWIIILVLLIPDMQPHNLLPVFANGVQPSLKGAVPTGGWFAHFALVSFLLPHLVNPQKAMKWGTIAAIFIMVTLVLITMATLFIFGDITSQLQYPVMMAIRYINVADFFEHVEAIMVAIWVIGAFIKISIYFYVFVLGTSQLLHLSDFRPIVYPSGILLALFTLWVAPNIQEFAHYLGTSTPFENMTFELVLPAGLLLAAILRNKFQPRVRRHGG